MKIIEHAFMFLGVGLSVFVLLYLAYLIYYAYVEVKGSPREDMYLCQRHGFMRRQQLITFSEQMDVIVGKDARGKDIVERKVVEYCPLCWHENMSKAEKAR
jgi:hypothetical protein